VPKIALPKFWLANILVELFLAHRWVNISWKNKLNLIVEHWQAKKLITIQIRTNLLVMIKKLEGYALVAIQTGPYSISHLFRTTVVEPSSLFFSSKPV
jgi:hypothetical protein